MATIITVHSYRGGTGKSNTTANVAALLAAQGYRVGVVDADIQSPGIHVLFGLDPEAVGRTLNDYIWGECEIEEAVYEVTPLLGVAVLGQIFLIPASVNPGEIARVLQEGYDTGLLNDGLQQAIALLDLDILLIDTHPGLNEETLLSIAISDTLLVILRPDSQDYQGTSVTIDVARRLGVPRLLLVVNNVPQSLDFALVSQRVEQSYEAPVAAVLPHSTDLLILASGGIFALRYPDHPLTGQYRQIAARLLEPLAALAV